MSTFNTRKLQTHITFHEEFKKYFKNVKENNDETSEVEKLLTILFLHLAFESFVTYSIRSAVENIFYESRELREVWHKEFEKAFIDKKIEFLAIIWLPHDENKIKKIFDNKFVKESTILRNWIVHGHAMEEYSFSDSPDVTYSKLYERLKKLNLENHYEIFKITINEFLDTLQFPPRRERNGINWFQFVNELRSWVA